MEAMLVTRRLNQAQNTFFLESSLKRTFEAGTYSHVTENGRNKIFPKKYNNEKVYAYKTDQKIPVVDISYDFRPVKVSLKA